MLGDNKLKKIKDEGAILSLINGAKEAQLEVFVWKLVGGEKILGQVKLESIRKHRKDFCIIPIEGQEREVQDLFSGSFVDFYIPGSALLLRCQIKQTDAPFRYYLHFPQHVAQVERRKHIRLNVYEGPEVKIFFSKSVGHPNTMTQHFYKSCFDISAGGFSFVISKMESKFFSAGDEIPVVEIKTGQWTGRLKAEVVTVRDVGPDEYNGMTYKSWRVCCRFVDIDQISRKYLDKFILERIKVELHAINE